MYNVSVIFKKISDSSMADIKEMIGIEENAKDFVKKVLKPTTLPCRYETSTLTILISKK